MRFLGLLMSDPSCIVCVVGNRDKEKEMFELQVVDHNGNWNLIARGGRIRLQEQKAQNMRFSGRTPEMYRIVNAGGML